jgi:S1-C subfamily serine protease
MRTRLHSLAALLAVLVALIPSSRAASPGANESPGWLGLRLGEVAGSSPENPGVLVRGVIEGSPADEAHLRAKDTILAVDGVAVGGPAELMARLRAMEPGSFVTLTVKRDAREFEVKAVLDTRPESMRLVRGWLGVEALELPASLRAHFGAPEDAGILVSAVSEASPAYDAGIRVGDVIYEADAQPVTSIRDLARLVSEAGVENVMEVVLARDGARIVVGPQIERVPAR